MADDRPTLEVAPREVFGSRATRRLRREGLVPGVVYGGGKDARAFQVGERELRAALQSGSAVLDLVFDGTKGTPVVIKDQQRHPVGGQVEHFDCLEVRLDVEIEAETILELEGTEEAPGVKEGGVLEHVTREITILALPTNIPERIPVDVSEMVIGDTIQLDTVTPPAGVKFTAENPEEVTVATLSPPRVEEEPEPELEEEAELVGEDGEPVEGEEAPEGEEGEAAESQEPEVIGKGGDSGDEG
jgi:large subunit ribosomal protein L25